MRALAAVLVVGGGVVGWVTSSAPLLILALIAWGLVLWADAHHPSRWEQP